MAMYRSDLLVDGLDLKKRHTAAVPTEQHDSEKSSENETLANQDQDKHFGRTPDGTSMYMVLRHIRSYIS